MLYFPRQDISSLEISGFWENTSAKESWSSRTDLQVLLLEQTPPWPAFWRMGDFFCTGSFNLKTFLFKATWWHRGPEAGTMKAAKLCWDDTRVPKTGREQQDIPSPAHLWQRQSLIFWDTRADTSLLPRRHELSRQLNKWNQKRSLEKKRPKSFKNWMCKSSFLIPAVSLSPWTYWLSPCSSKVWLLIHPPVLEENTPWRHHLP